MEARPVWTLRTTGGFWEMSITMSSVLLTSICILWKCEIFTFQLRESMEGWTFLWIIYSTHIFRQKIYSVRTWTTTLGGFQTGLNESHWRVLMPTLSTYWRFGLLWCKFCTISHDGPLASIFRRKNQLCTCGFHVFLFSIVKINRTNKPVWTGGCPAKKGTFLMWQHFHVRSFLSSSKRSKHILTSFCTTFSESSNPEIY